MSNVVDNDDDDLMAIFSPGKKNRRTYIDNIMKEGVKSSQVNHIHVYLSGCAGSDEYCWLLSLLSSNVLMKRIIIIT